MPPPFLHEMENAVEEEKDDEEEKRTPGEFESPRWKRRKGRKDERAGGDGEGGDEVDGAKTANVTCLFFTIEAHCS